MRTGNLGSVAYAPGQPPTDPKALPAYLTTELRNLANVVQLLAAGHIDKTHVEPSRPRDGDLVYADGSDFDPGSGRGLYQYRDDAAWHFIG